MTEESKLPPAIPLEAVWPHGPHDVDDPPEIWRNLPLYTKLWLARRSAQDLEELWSSDPREAQEQRRDREYNRKLRRRGEKLIMVGLTTVVGGLVTAILSIIVLGVQAWLQQKVSGK